MLRESTVFLVGLSLFSMTGLTSSPSGCCDTLIDHGDPSGTPEYTWPITATPTATPEATPTDTMPPPPTPHPECPQGKVYDIDELFPVDLD